MGNIDVGADELVSKLLGLSAHERVGVLDSCGVGHLGSHLLIAGANPVKYHEIRDGDARVSVKKLEELLSGDLAAIFTISYDLGPRLDGIISRAIDSPEPDISVMLFDELAVHNYELNSTFVSARKGAFENLSTTLEDAKPVVLEAVACGSVSSNFTREEYVSAIETIKEFIRDGHTYQANLTQRFTVNVSSGPTAANVFSRVRRDHPAPFAAFIQRGSSTVVSASPERFFRIEGRAITTSPIKGTRPRGSTPVEDDALRSELLTSEKDRAENTMIVDLLRNDLGRVCDFGTVSVERLCELEEHPTLFHLVSTINGRLRRGVSVSDVINALFPCGSITGAPKISTMQIIDEIERTPRGLSMGAIGYYIPDHGYPGLSAGIDCSVAIRTMVFANGRAVFNVGGGITIDSDAAAEYDESLLKAKALLNALGNKPA